MNTLRKDTLAREIALVLVIKLILLFGLWFAFFRHPITHDLTPAGVSRAIVGDLPNPSVPTDARLHR